MFSETSAAATYWGIMKPELRPPSRTRNGGSPSESVGLTIRSMRRSEMLASSATAIASTSSAKASGCPWKLPADTISALVDEHERIVRGGVQLHRDGRLDVVEQVTTGAVHLRRATE